MLAGAQMLQVFESHAGILGPQLFSDFCLPYLKQIAEQLKERLKKRNFPTDIPLVTADGYVQAYFKVILLEWHILQVLSVYLTMCTCTCSSGAP